MRTLTEPDALRDHAIAYGADLVRRICAVAGPLSFLEDLQQELTDDGVIAAVRQHDTAAIFAWLVTQLSMQGISNGVAVAYMNRHGVADWAVIETALARSPSCPKLRGYWAFHFPHWGRKNRSPDCSGTEHRRGAHESLHSGHAV